MQILSDSFRAVVRVALWIAVAFSSGFATLWVFERLLFAGVFGLSAPGETWFYVVWVTVALVAGGTVASVVDRAYTSKRHRSRVIGRRSTQH
jgi:hypothetical protein